MEQVVQDGAREIYQVEQSAVVEKPVYQAVKRLFDVVVSALALLILGIPMLLLMPVIRADSPGPAIFRQERLGKGGKPFVIYKYRTMQMDAERDGPQWARVHDVRCTKLGRLLRRGHIDELPQLVNVLRGEMSLVGPRPERACFYQEFERYIRGFSQRLQVTPGITGWAQINGGYELLPEEKILFDMEYIRHRSVMFDIRCLLGTVRVVFRHDGAR
ncbi:MAG TPA: sugar transferase [Clostridiales bacterium]|nr:sugar transferase [Clostridiales bacterium]